MTAQVTIIGLGRVGTSIGLALADQKEQLFRVGHDKIHSIAVQAEKMGACDKTINNLYAAVEKADLIVLAMPVDEVYETIKLIANDLKEDAVILDTSPCLVAACQWAKELLPAKRHFATLAPSINPEYLAELSGGPEVAKADLFKNSTITITTPQGTDAGVIKLAVDLTTLLGAKPYFADAMEYDGLTAPTNTLTKLVAVAMTKSTVEQPGWIEGRKLAGHDFLIMTEPLNHLDEEKKFGLSAILNKDNTVRVLDNLIASLRTLREAIINDDQDTLTDSFKLAVANRDKWYTQRMKSDWEKSAQAEIPTTGETMGRLFLGGLFRKREKPDQK